MSSSSPMCSIGYPASPMKVQRFIQNSLINQAKQHSIDLIKIDPTKPLAQQGPFDCIINKLYGPDWNHQLHLLSLHHPNVVVIDPPQAIKRILNRVSMLDVVTRLKLPQGNQTFGVPNQRVVYESENLMDLVGEVGLKFPLIAKPLLADGKGEAEGLLLLSQVSNLVVKNEVEGCCSEVKKFVARNEEDKCCSSEVEKLVEKAEMPPLEFVMELAKGLREAMGLRLFNFDLIRDSRDGNRYFVIDINYFPGYVKMPEYESVFVDFFFGCCGREEEEE
ncbi:hypothetical protein SO802_023774 [Lithocarpus litseifolius]|uniref:Inositol-tetrakisphosphate 1-kinase n=1 Tax=Lithocarpus litseifolius TaxID=425828 RepID=A0AAW2C756_9ROSI